MALLSQPLPISLYSTGRRPRNLVKTNFVYLSYKEGEVIFRGSLPNFKEAKRESDSLACTTHREKGANSRG